MAIGYDLLIHRHRFAAWAAARASQRGLVAASSALLTRSLESLGFPQTLETVLTAIASAEDFDAIHRQNCGRIVAFLAQNGVKPSFGRAAKLLAIYLKSMVILG